MLFKIKNVETEYAYSQMQIFELDSIFIFFFFLGLKEQQWHPVAVKFSNIFFFYIWHSISSVENRFILNKM